MAITTPKTLVAAQRCLPHTFWRCCLDVASKQQQKGAANEMQPTRARSIPIKKALSPFKPMQSKPAKKTAEETPMVVTLRVGVHIQCTTRK
jgi:hypothetical protein